MFRVRRDAKIEKLRDEWDGGNDMNAHLAFAAVLEALEQM